MDFLKYIKKGRTRHREPRPLRIEGVRTQMTPQPDDAELAAQALLETLASEKGSGKSERLRVGELCSGMKSATAKKKHSEPKQGTPEYYRRLSEKIRASRAAEARLTMRYLAYCEEQLALPKELYVGQTGEMERELYKRQDIAEREGGELLRRWQHCLAEVIVRQMSAATENTTTEQTDYKQSNE